MCCLPCLPSAQCIQSVGKPASFLLYKDPHLSDVRRNLRQQGNFLNCAVCLSPGRNGLQRMSLPLSALSAAFILTCRSSLPRKALPLSPESQVFPMQLGSAKVLCSFIPRKGMWVFGLSARKQRTALAVGMVQGNGLPGPPVFSVRPLEVFLFWQKKRQPSGRLNSYILSQWGRQSQRSFPLRISFLPSAAKHRFFLVDPANCILGHRVL